jgi:hypothetical protein
LLAGTNEKAIISVVAYRSNPQRQQIKEKFKSMYGKVSQNELSYSDKFSRVQFILFFFFAYELLSAIIGPCENFLLYGINTGTHGICMRGWEEIPGGILLGYGGHEYNIGWYSNLPIT